MGKFLLSTLLLLTTAFASTAETVTFTLKDYCTNAQTITSKTIEDITLSFAKGTNTNNAPTYYDSGDAGRMYAGNTFTVTWQDGVKIESIKYTWVKKGSKWGTSSPTTVESVDIPTSGNSVTVSVNSKDNGVRDLTVTYALSSGPTYPTECTAPTFKINGTETHETEAIAYAGTKISVSCATPKAITDWIVNDLPINDSEYVIPANAKPGDIYSFRAQSRVQGQVSMIESTTTDLIVKITEMPSIAFFYANGYVSDEIPNYATALIGTSNSKTNALTSYPSGFDCSVINISFTQTEKSSGTTYYPFINSNKSITMYEGSSFTISSKEGYAISKIEFNVAITENLDSDKGIISSDGKTWTASEIESSSVTFSKKGSDTWKGITAISTIAVYYEKLPETPVMPRLHPDCADKLSGNTISGEGSLTIKFATVENHVNLYYKFIENTVEPELAALANAADPHDGYNLYDKENGLTLTTKDNGKTLEVFACDSNTEKHSDSVQYTISMITTGVAEIEAAGAGEVRWFDMQGREVKGQPEKGIYVRVANGKASKVIL